MNECEYCGGRFPNVNLLWNRKMELVCESCDHTMKGIARYRDQFRVEYVIGKENPYVEQQPEECQEESFTWV